MDTPYRILFSLIRCGLNSSVADESIANELASLTAEEWMRVAKASSRQSVTVLAYDGLEAVIAAHGKTVVVVVVLVAV